MGSWGVAAGANPSLVSGRGQGTPWTSHQLIAGPSLMSNVGFSILLKDTLTCSSALPGAGIWASDLLIISQPALPAELQLPKSHFKKGNFNFLNNMIKSYKLVLTTDHSIQQLCIASFCVSSSSSYLVHSIRPVLCLQTKGAVLHVSSPALSCYWAIQEVGSVELDSWLACSDLQDTPTGWVIHSERWRKKFSCQMILMTILCV